MTIPHYHEQPATLDPNQPIPEDTETVPLAQGHLNTDRAADVAEAAVEHRDAVEAEAEARTQASEAGEPEPGAVRTPDQVAKDEQREQEAGSSSSPTSGDDSCPPNGTIDEVLAWVGDDHDRAQQALSAERDGQNRSSLIAKLEAI